MSTKLSSQMPENAPPPRLCHVRKSYPEQEYGFNLHAEKGQGQFIGSVDSGSPADLAHLKSGDRIIGVNGAVVVEESHRQVVGRIKEDPLQCTLLVIDKVGEEWYKQRKISITPDMPHIIMCGPSGEQRTRVVDEPPVPPPDYDSALLPDSPPPIDNAQPADAHSPYSTHSHRSGDPAPTMNGRSEGGLPCLCALRKASPKEEYGFNLHAEKGKGHFIGKVDQDSLAARAGLQQGQRIVGVNRTLIYPNTPHKVCKRSVPL